MIRYGELSTCDCPLIHFSVFEGLIKKYLRYNLVPREVDRLQILDQQGQGWIDVKQVAATA